LEYIQCPHCEKKYAVNDRIKASVGKQIRCKHCQATFSIIIQHTTGKEEVQEQQTVEASSSVVKTVVAAQPEVTKVPDANEKPPHEDISPTKPVKKKASGKKPLNLQLIITIVLAVILIIGSIAAYLFINNPELFNPPAKKESSHIIEPVIPAIDPFAMPIIPALKSEQAAEQAAASPPVDQNDSGVVTTAIEPAMATANNQPEGTVHTATQACKDAAAKHWVRTYKLAHTRLSGEAYYTLFDEGVKQTDELRTLCKDNSLVASLTTAANEKIIPEWIRLETQALMDIEAARQKQLESANP